MYIWSYVLTSFHNGLTNLIFSKYTMECDISFFSVYVITLCLVFQRILNALTQNSLIAKRVNGSGHLTRHYMPQLILSNLTFIGNVKFYKGGSIYNL